MPRRFAPRNDRGEVSSRPSALQPLTRIFLQHVTASLQPQTRFCLLHVIASQCAHWRGNPFSPQRSLASWLLFGQIRTHLPSLSLRTSAHTGVAIRSPRRGAWQAGCCSGKFVVLFGFAQSIAFHFVLPQENGLPRRFAPRNDMQKFAKCSHSNALVRNDMRKVETCQRCQGALPGCRRKTFLLPAFTRFRSFPRLPSGWRARSPAR